jgi:hypothetical protein
MHTHDFNYYFLMGAAVLAFSVVIAALAFLYNNSKKNKGDK